MDDPGEVSRHIGSGVPVRVDVEPSSAWFPQLVTPGNFLGYWNDVDSRYWPMLAKHWLSAGFESNGTRWLAALDEGEARDVTTDQMVTVLRSLGVAIELPAEFIARCDRVIARIQPDLDATGCEQYRMQAANAAIGHDALPAVYAALPDGSWWSSGAAMTPDMDDPALLLTAAESVSDTLTEVLRVFWPTCVQHAGPPMTLEQNRKNVVPVWRCERGQHDLAPLGRLTQADVEH
jgi:hypothetical protein